MDTRLQIVERLYSEGEDNHVPHPIGSDEEKLAREFQAMSRAKFWMDHRRRVRPDAATIDRVVEAAASAGRGAVPGVVRPDRSPLRLVTAPRFRMAVAVTLVAVVAGLGVWRMVLEPPATTDRMMSQEMEGEPGLRADSKAVAPTLADADRPAEEAIGLDSPDDSATLAGRASIPAAAVVAASATDWDETGEVRRLHQRIEMLRSRQADEGWDKPMVPLEMMPVGEHDAGIHQAGSGGN